MSTNKIRKKNYYAIYYIGSGESIIVKTWRECQKKTQGRANKLKGFGTEEEARKWLEEIDPKTKAAALKRLHKNKPEKKTGPQRVNLQLTFKQKDLSELRKRAESIKMPIETLVENLVLEYIYDIEE